MSKIVIEYNEHHQSIDTKFRATLVGDDDVIYVRFGSTPETELSALMVTQDTVELLTLVSLDDLDGFDEE